MPIASSHSSRPLLPRLRLLAEVLYHQIDRDRLFTQSAALTYKTLFSLLPIFALSLLLLSAIGGTGGGAGGTGAGGGGGGNSLVDAVKRTFFQQLDMDKLQITDEAGQQIRLASYVDRLIANAQSAVSKTAAGVSLVAFLVLLYGAITLMVVIEGAFNQIYGSVPARSWARRIMLYWCVLTLGPIGIAVSLSLGRAAFSSSSHFAAAWLLAMVNLVTSFLVSWLLILLMYRIIPDTRVYWRDAALGSFLAALAWEIGKWAFGLYVATTAKNSWYGSLALLPLFMFWIYITWSVVLIGLEISYTRQFWHLLKRRYLFLRAKRRARAAAGGGFAGAAGMEGDLSDLRWVLPLGILLYRRFQDGTPTPADAAAEALMLPNDVAGELLLALEKAGIVHAVANHAYTLARPPESITAHDLLTAARAMCQVPPDLAKEVGHSAASPQTPALQELEALESAWAKSKTLADLARQPVA